MRYRLPGMAVPIIVIQSPDLFCLLQEELALKDKPLTLPGVEKGAIPASGCRELHTLSEVLCGDPR